MNTTLQPSWSMSLSAPTQMPAYKSKVTKRGTNYVHLGATFTSAGVQNRWNFNHLRSSFDQLYDQFHHTNETGFRDQNTVLAFNSSQNTQAVYSIKGA